MSDPSNIPCFSGGFRHAAIAGATTIRLMLAFCVVLLASASAMAQTREPALEPRMMMTAIDMRKAVDQDWELRIAGEIPSRAGTYLVMYNALGKLTLQKHIPHGVYDAQNPLVIPMAADGYVGDYRLHIIGQQEDMLGLLLPISSLPLEVYTGTYFAARQTPPIFFKAPPGVEVLHLHSARVGQEIHEGDQLVLDTQKDGVQEKLTWVAPLKTRPDAVYSFRRMNVLYFGAKEPLHLCFDIQRWFVPDPRLDDIQWWESTQ